jgi:CRP/FNR family transcriptional regulator, anaerobic regulatory protein
MKKWYTLPTITHHFVRIANLLMESLPSALFLVQLFPELSLFPTIIDELMQACKRHILKPKQLLITAGTVNDRLYFIEKGLLRGYYYTDTDTDTDTDTTSWFEAEGGIITLPHSFFGRQPAFEYVEAVERCAVYSISRYDLARFQGEHSVVQLITQRLSEQYMIEFENRLRMLRLKKANQRLQFFQSRYPDIYRRAPLKATATYLNMTPERLSQLRQQR